MSYTIIQVDDVGEVNSIITQADNTTIIQVDVGNSMTTQADSTTVVTTVDVGSSIITQADSTTVITTVDVGATVIESIGIGPQGIPGPAGDTSVYYEAGQTVSGHRAVILEDDKIYYADCATPSHAKRVLGITTGAAMLGSLANVQVSGELSESSWAWALDTPVWLGTNGLLSQLPPASGFSLIVGFPASSTKLLVRISEPIFLI